jgi:hypothetical protein
VHDSLQLAIVIAIVVACAFMVVRGAVRSMRGRKTACGCEKCPAVDRRARPADASRAA